MLIKLKFLAAVLFFTSSWSTAACLDSYSDSDLAATTELSALRGSSQALIVTQVQGVAATLTSLKKSGSHWRAISHIPVVIGLAGFAAPGEKVEGDRKTPSGIYDLGTSFGTSNQIDSKMPYRQTTAEDKYIDDVNSAQYNTWVQGPTSAKSFESMRRTDSLYEHGIVVEYNQHPVVKGKGSAIFIHQWRGPDQGTMGCVAMERPHLMSLLTWLDPKRHPKLILNRQLPQSCSQDSREVSSEKPSPKHAK